MFRNPGAYRLYLFYSGATYFAMALAFTLMGVYRVQEAGLNPLQLVLVGTALEVTYFLFNVPTGVVADTYSRRLSVIVGAFLFGAGLLVEGAIPLFGAIVLAQVIEGLAYTFIEGALEAWLADEVGEQQLAPALLRGSQVGGAAGFAGIWACVALGSFGLALPILAGAALWLLVGLYLVLAMREPGFRRPERSADPASGALRRTAAAVREMGETARAGGRVVRRRPLALTILLVAAVFGGFSEGLDRLSEAHFLTSIGLPGLGALPTVVWFGIIAAGGTLLGIGAAEIVRRRVDLAHAGAPVRALFVLNAALIASVVVFALAGNFALALGAYWTAGVMRGLQGPVYQAWLNRNVDPRVRATVISLSGQADALGQFTVGPGIGALGVTAGLRAALAAAGLALSPALVLYARALHRGEAAARPTTREEVAAGER